MKVGAGPRVKKMATKRSLEVECEEGEDVSAVVSPSAMAKIHGVVTSISPMKKSRSCSYFDGEITDGKANMRIFGFDAAAGVRKKLLEFEGKKESVMLSKCEVKRARQGDQMEVCVGKYMEVEKSEKVFDVGNVADKKKGKAIVLSGLGQLSQFQRVSAAVKAIRVDEVVEVAGGKKKQDVIIADRTGKARLTVWEKEIGKLTAGESYQLSGMVVREYRGTRFLSTSRENSEISPISNIGDIDDKPVEGGSESTDTTTRSGRIVGVLALESYDGCIKCHGKVAPDPEDDELGQCVKCHMLQCAAGCKKQLTARVMVEDGGVHLTLRAFGKVVVDMAEKTVEGDVTERVLLKSKPFSFIQDGGIIQSVHRK